MQLETERLILRPWRVSDAESLYKYASDPEVGPRAGWDPHKSVEESRTMIETFFNTDYFWAVELKETSEAIGCIGYLPPEISNIPIADNDAEVGYWIARPYWNRGLCTEALAKLVDYCFREKNFDTLWGDYFTDNPASCKVMLHCGFHDCNRETHCPNLQSGADKTVRVMKLSKVKNN